MSFIYGHVRVVSAGGPMQFDDERAELHNANRHRTVDDQLERMAKMKHLASQRSADKTFADGLTADELIERMGNIERDMALDRISHDRHSAIVEEDFDGISGAWCAPMVSSYRMPLSDPWLAGVPGAPPEAIGVHYNPDGTLVWIYPTAKENP